MIPIFRPFELFLFCQQMLPASRRCWSLMPVGGTASRQSAIRRSDTRHDVGSAIHRTSSNMAQKGRHQTPA